MRKLLFILLLLKITLFGQSKSSTNCISLLNNISFESKRETIWKDSVLQIDKYKKEDDSFSVLSWCGSRVIIEGRPITEWDSIFIFKDNRLFLLPYFIDGSFLYFSYYSDGMREKVIDKYMLKNGSLQLVKSENCYRPIALFVYQEKQCVFYVYTTQLEEARWDVEINVYCNKKHITKILKNLSSVYPEYSIDVSNTAIENEKASKRIIKIMKIKKCTVLRTKKKIWKDKNR